MQGGTDMEKNITIRPERVSDYQQVELSLIHISEPTRH